MLTLRQKLFAILHILSIGTFIVICPLCYFDAINEDTFILSMVAILVMQILANIIGQRFIKRY